MSAGFRLFLLILAAFGAIYAYHARYPELSRWLKAESVSSSAEADNGLTSPVDSILASDVSLAQIILHSPPARSPVDLSQELPNFEAGNPEADDLANFSELPAPSEETAEGDVLSEPSVADAPEPPEQERVVELQHLVEQPPAGPQYEELEYKVRSGDNLWKIAQEKLGSGSRFGEIREANLSIFKAGQGDIVQAGMVLKIRVPICKEILKDTPRDVDSTVEGNSARGPTDSRRKSLRQSKQLDKARKIAQEVSEAPW